MTNVYYQNRRNGKTTVDQTTDMYELPIVQLLPISPFENRRQKISSLRCEVRNLFTNTHPFSQKNMIKTNRKNSIEKIKQLVDGEDISFSNIQQLKNHVLQLEDKHIGKLGKQNASLQIPARGLKIMTVHSECIVDKCLIRQSKKSNRRKIVKGRPQIYKMIKKRKFLQNLFEEQKPLLNITDRRNFNPIKDILNKNNLLKFISIINEKRGNHNLYDNQLRQKTEDLNMKKKPIDIRQAEDRRRSMITFNNENVTFAQKKNQCDNVNNGKEMVKKQKKYQQNNRRYSSAHRHQ